MMYDFCKRCGAPHDDGTADYCMYCLDVLYCEEGLEPEEEGLEPEEEPEPEIVT